MAYQIDLRRERDATDRDENDLWTLAALRQIVAQAIDLASLHDEISHPDRKWSTDCLLDSLRGELANIDGAAAMIRRSPLILEDE